MAPFSFINEQNKKLRDFYDAIDDLEDFNFTKFYKRRNVIKLYEKQGNDRKKQIWENSRNKLKDLENFERWIKNQYVNKLEKDWQFEKNGNLGKTKIRHNIENSETKISSKIICITLKKDHDVLKHWASYFTMFTFQTSKICLLDIQPNQL